MKLSRDMLADEPLIICPRKLGPGFHDAILSACKSAGFTPHIGQEAPQIAAMAPMVASQSFLNRSSKFMQAA